ncbi:hypothetical protein ACHAPI_011673 [Fusarium lateritium]
MKPLNEVRPVLSCHAFVGPSLADDEDLDATNITEYAVTLRARESLEPIDTNLLSKRVDTGMLEELVTIVVD